MKKRLVSLLLALSMAVALFPVSALAETTSNIGGGAYRRGLCPILSVN